MVLDILDRYDGVEAYNDACEGQQQTLRNELPDELPKAMHTMRSLLAIADTTIGNKRNDVFEFDSS